MSILPSEKIIDKKYNIENQSFNFNRNIRFFKLLETVIENKFTIYGILKIKSDIYYKYDDLEKYLYRLCHKYQFYGDKDTLFYEILLNSYNFGKSDNNILYVKDDFYVELKGIYSKIKIVFLLSRINPRGTVSFYLKHINDNFINIIYLDKTDISLKIDKNKDNISANLSEISNIKNNKTYLKHIYNILLYDKKTQIDFKNLFYEKVFDINANHIF